MSEVQPVAPVFDSQPKEAGRRGQVEDPYLSVAASARALRISPATLRRYIKDYNRHLDVGRNGRKLTVAVSSIPALAQIRDLRARKVSREEIQRILAMVPSDVALAGLAPSTPAIDKPGEDKRVEEAIAGLRAELASVKRISQDNDVVVRQTLANLLFLIDKFSKELQFHVSEERIASTERDLRLTRYEDEFQRLSEGDPNGNGLFETVAGHFRRLLGAAFSR